jgi:uncharacterized protein YndB with AHSA1/START domain
MHGVEEIRISADVSAPPEVAWQLFTDHRGWERWSGAKEVVLRQEGDPAPNGLGAIRVLRARGLAIEEEVTAFDAPRRMAYRLVAGIPIRDHCGEVEFAGSDAGTEVNWSVRFRPLIPGTGGLLRRVFQRVLETILRRFAEELRGASTA